MLLGIPVMPIRKGQTQLRLVPPCEEWAIELLTHSDYDDYWSTSFEFQHLYNNDSNRNIHEYRYILIPTSYSSSSSRSMFSSVGRCARRGM